MEAKYEARKQELLEECTVAPQIFERVMPRLERVMEPFVENLVRKEQCKHASTFVQGLLSNLEHKNTESIAYRFGQQRMGLQWFVGKSDWDHEPLRDELVRQVGAQLGEEDGVIVFDPSGFPKAGRASVGVARQWCGRLGVRRARRQAQQGRQLPGGCLPGICFEQRTCPGRYAAVPSPGVDER